MNIGLITNEFPPYTSWGGVASYYATLAIELHDHGHEVTVISRMSKFSSKEDLFLGKVKVIRVGPPIERKKFTGRTVDKMLYSRKIYKKIQSLNKIKPFDIIEFPEFTLEYFELLRKNYLIDKTIIQCHGSNAKGLVPKNILYFLHYIDLKCSYFFEIFCLKKMKYISVPSKSGKEFLIKNGIQTKNINIIHHGINTENFVPKIRKNTSVLRIGFVGKIHKQKGIDFFYQIISGLSKDLSFQFNIFGEIHPSEKEKLSFFLKKYHKNLTHHPHCDHSRMPAVYHSLDILLLPSRFEEFGLVYAEAMASGLITFVGQNGGGSEIVENREDGYIINPDNHKDIAFVLEKLSEIKSNPNKFKFLRNKAREKIVGHFSLKSSVKKKLDFYFHIKNKND